MLICHCRAVNDRVTRTTVAAGARDPREIAEGCGAGGECGGYVPALLALLDQARVDGDGRERVRHASAA